MRFFERWVDRVDPGLCAFFVGRAPLPAHPSDAHEVLAKQTASVDGAAPSWVPTLLEKSIPLVTLAVTKPVHRLQSLLAWACIVSAWGAEFGDFEGTATEGHGREVGVKKQVDVS